MPFADNGGVRLAYEEHGEGQPIVLVPGLGLAGTALADTVAGLRDRYRVLTVDPRGAGGSDKPDVPYTGETFAQDLVAVFDAARLERAHLLGLSMGGMIAQEFAIRFPDRVGALVLLSTYAATDDWSRRLFEVRRTMIERLGLLQHFKLSIMFVFSPAAFRNMRERVRVIEDALMVNPPDERAYLRQIQYCLDHDARGRLGSISAPTLVVTGSADILTSRLQGRDLAESIRDAEYVEVPGASHGLFLEATGTLVEAVDAFARRHPVAPQGLQVRG
jgi:3-oxoadipate enol-lactonase